MRLAPLLVACLACAASAGDAVQLDGGDARWLRRDRATPAAVVAIAGAGAGAVLQLTADRGAGANLVPAAGDWSGHRYLTVDLDVDGVMPVALEAWWLDEAGRAVCVYPVVPAGRSTLSLDVVANAGDPPVERARIARFGFEQLWEQPGSVVVSRPRLTRVDERTPRPSAAEAIDRAYAPPPAFAEAGPQRSPLLFDDGTPVADAADWPRRRAEILAAWHAEMGAWPAPLEAPSITVLAQEDRDGIAFRRVRVDVAAERAVEGWLLVPPGAAASPAVLTVFYHPEGAIGERGGPGTDYARQLARRGIVALSIGIRPLDVAKPESRAFYPRDVQPLSFLAYVASNCRRALARLPEVDPARVGVMGHSYGGKWAMFASCLDDGFAAGAWSDHGIVFDEAVADANYWEPWYLGQVPGDVQRPRGLLSPEHPRVGAYARLVDAGRDLHELHALMAPRPFLVSGGAVDPPSRWRALAHAIAVNRLLGAERRVAMTNRGPHATDAEAAAEIVEFFTRALGAATPAR
ncbi:MAG TPA: hypothetical protein VEL07_15870 [Planctomycetota bacterium]|nr:hypothetical protein [Planctomycetota bacterium]